MDRSNDAALPQAHANFNASALKIFSLTEFNERVAALRAETLSPGEQLLAAAVAAPVSLFAGAMLAVKLAVNSDTRHAFGKAAGDGSYGYYRRGKTRDVYVNAGIVPLAEAATRNFTLTPALSQKLRALEAEALAGCQDHSGLRDTGRILPG